MRDLAWVEFAEALECVCKRVREHVRMAGGASSGESRLQDAEEEVDKLRVSLRGITVICIGGLIAGES